MNYLTALRCAAALVLVSTVAKADAILTIGNSLTWDARPQLLAGDVDWHVYCARNLQYIKDNPNGHCITSSTPWSVAFANKDYDYVVVQPFVGTTFAEDRDVISSWMALQPDAKFVLHTGWAGPSSHAGAFSDPNPDLTEMSVSPKYFETLIDELAVLHPGQEVTRTKAADLIYSISQDIENDVGPYDELSEIYRDSIHMSFADGRYLAHNSLRLALGQEISDEGFSVSETNKSYLNAKLFQSVPEPSAILLLQLCTLLGLFRRHRLA